ncbi:MAG: small subunit ribosomal protein, partial [Patescibacteria group bacterium]|nr:small subunit ribosomal protein [Patescibacteria group bacterium]
LTNYSEVSKNFKKLKDLTKFMTTPSEKARFTKKEISLMERERIKLDSFYWGVLEMPGVPSAVFIVDTHKEDLAVREALATNIPIVGITDTNSDPSIIDYPIPANDDAAGSVKLIVDHIVDAWIEGRKAMNAPEEEPKKEKAPKKEVEKVEEKKEEVKKEVKATVEKKAPKKTAAKATK